MSRITGDPFNFQPPAAEDVMVVAVDFDETLFFRPFPP